MSDWFSVVLLLVLIFLVAYIGGMIDGYIKRHD